MRLPARRLAALVVAAGLSSVSLVRAQDAVPPAPAPAPDAAPVARLAFGSCSKEDAPQPIWDRVLAAAPDVYVALGDTVYGDTTDMEVLRAKYARQAAVPGFAALRRSCRFLATWDDHDYGRNDAGAEYPQKQASKDVFLEFLGEPASSPRRAREGVYDAVVLGPPGRRVQVVLLDTRWFRGPLAKERVPDDRPGSYEPDPDPSVPMLGEAQWAWLAERLREPAELRIVASSIQVVAEDHDFEKWANLPRERERLFATIRAAGAAGVVFVSGDRHLAEISAMDGGVGYPLYDVTASAINRSAKRWRPLEENRHRVATMNVGDNFGVIEVAWGEDPVLRLQIRDDEGAVAHQVKVPLSVLAPRRR